MIYHLAALVMTNEQSRFGSCAAHDGETLVGYGFRKTQITRALQRSCVPRCHHLPVSWCSVESVTGSKGAALKLSTASLFTFISSSGIINFRPQFYCLSLARDYI